MRFSDIPISPASLAATTIVAAAFGLATVSWTSTDAVSPADLPMMYEEVTVTAEAEPSSVMVELRSQRSIWLAGENIVLEAEITNLTDAPAFVSAAGLYDLAVQRVSSPDAMAPGGIAFLALAEVGAEDSIVLAPGQTITRQVEVGSDEPFDRPGRYRVSGSWLGADHPAVVPAFEVVVQPDEAIASQQAGRPAPGA